jgi:hypothetical protein
MAISRIADSKNGDTPLHCLIRVIKEHETFKADLAKLDQKLLPVMAITINNNGDLPLQLLDKDKMGAEDYGKCKMILLILMQQYSKDIPKLSTPIDFADIIKKYRPIPGSPLEKNLKYACYAANVTRSHIKKTQKKYE